ncbi:MAG: DUF885 domain-containing protein [Lachnospiraceae bacterium]|nr:DUF885 domain-containing protein [Lachnospiraceae bacterium]
MKQTPHLSFRQLLAAGTLLIFFTLLTCSLYKSFSAWKAVRIFETFSRELFIREMTSDTLTLHYSLAHPENYGITYYPVTLPYFTPGSETASRKEPEDTLRKLRAIPFKSLSAEDRYACGMLSRSLELSIRLSDYPYYAEPLSPVGGAHSRLPILFDGYVFRSRKDVEDYLTLLGQTEEYFSSLLAYEQKKIECGTFMSAESLTQTIDQCNTIITPHALKSGTHFLQTGFEHRVRDLFLNNLLSQEELSFYITCNNRLLLEEVLPAYQSLSARLTALLSHAASSTRGLASFPRGKEYYLALLSLQTGSDRPLNDLRQMLENKLREDCTALQKLLQDYPQCKATFMQKCYQDLGFSDTHVIISNLREHMQNDFPSFPADSPSLKIDIRTVPDALQNVSAPAYYLTSPIDNFDTNVIYVNPKSDPSNLELYTTLSHEGFPGHLYQSSFCASHLLSLKNSLLRQLLGSSGYLEGWALYAELLSYDYAALILSQQGRPLDTICVRIEKYSRSIQLCLYSLLDLMIHYDGMSPEQIADFLEPFRITDPDTVSSLYRYICQAPCNYPKYYLGYLEILNLKQKARGLWAESYSEIRFHKFLLENGPADFTALNELLCEDASNALQHKLFSPFRLMHFFFK